MDYLPALVTQSTAITTTAAVVQYTFGVGSELGMEIVWLCLEVFKAWPAYYVLTLM